MNFFYLKYLFFFGGAMGGAGARVSDIFSMNPNLINPDKFGCTDACIYTKLKF